MITQCLRYPDIRGVIGRKTLKSLKESTANTLFSLLKEWEVPYKYNQLDNFVQFENGSRIIFKEMASTPGDPNFERFGSSEFTLAFVDEISECSEKAVEVLRSRLRWKVAEYGLIPKLLGSTNPSMNWVRSRFVIDDEGNPVETAEDEAYIPFSVFDNPNVAFRDAYAQSLGKIRDQQTRDRLLNGNWSFVQSNDGAAYWGFDGNKHLITGLKKTKYDPDKTLHLTFDFNLYPYMSCLAIQLDTETKKIYVLEELLGKPENKQNNSKGICKVIMDKYGDHLGGVIIYGDPNGKRLDTRSEGGHNDFVILQNELAELSPSLKVHAAHPPVKQRIEWINEIFDKNLHGWKIYVDMYCRKFTEDLIYGPITEDGVKDKSKVRDAKLEQRYEKWHHLTDAFDYFITMCLKAEFARFKKGGVYDARPATARNTSLGLYRF